MFCSKCGTKIDDDSNFCKSCGAPQRAGVQPKKRVMEICQIKQASDTKIHYFSPSTTTKWWYEAWCGAVKKAESVVVRKGTAGNIIEAKQGLIDSLDEDGWEPIVDPSTGEINSMQREKA